MDTNLYMQQLQWSCYHHDQEQQHCQHERSDEE